MFSQGQLVFAILFLIFFTIAIGIAYKRDKGLHLKNYRGVKWVLLSFIGFVIFLFLVKYFLKN